MPLYFELIFLIQFVDNFYWIRWLIEIAKLIHFLKEVGEG